MCSNECGLPFVALLYMDQIVSTQQVQHSKLLSCLNLLQKGKESKVAKS